MKVIGYKYHALYFAVIKFYNYTFNYYPTIPSGAFRLHTIFFLADSIVLIGYFYLVMFLSRAFLNRMKLFIPFQLLLLITGCSLIAIGQYYFNHYVGMEQPYIQVYFLKLFEVTFITFSAIGFLFLQKWYESSQQKVELIESLSEAELTFLRSQMSPHFLLNTLNSIYSLALNNSTETKTAIIELKNIYSYVQFNQDKVSLGEEIHYLENFIKIQKRRIGKHLQLSLDVVVDKEYDIEPLLLSTFIENAFKHGVSMREPSYIHIMLHAVAGQFEYRVINSDHSQKYKDETSGIGLKNLTRRMQLLYPGRFTLEFSSNNGAYSSTLSIHSL